MTLTVVACEPRPEHWCLVVFRARFNSRQAANIRVALDARLRRLLLGPLFGARSSLIRSIPEALHREAVAAHVESIGLIAEASLAHYQFPPEYPVWFRRTKAFDDKHSYVLRDVIVSPRSGQVWTPDGLLFVESVGSVQRMFTWGSTAADTLQRPIKHAPDHALIIACPPTGYFHFLLEILPHLIYSLSANHGKPTILVPDDAPAYVLTTIDALRETGAYEFDVLSADSPVLCSRLAMSTIEPHSGFVRWCDIDTIRQAVGSAPVSSRSARRIYVSRSQEPRRSLANEVELEEALRTIGFEIVFAENHTVAEQRAIFASSSVIVAPHGAGLSNIIWAPSDAALVEIFPYTMFNDCYARLARTLGLEYRYVKCSSSDGGHGCIPVQLVVDQVRMELGDGSELGL